MTRVQRAGQVTFAALAVPNYRRYIGGQSEWLSLSTTQDCAVICIQVPISDTD